MSKLVKRYRRKGRCLDGSPCENFNKNCILEGVVVIGDICYIPDPDGDYGLEELSDLIEELKTSPN